MPIGKNALKRVSNNGYSAVNTSAPDMEHSEVIEPKTEPTETKTEEKPATKKPTQKKSITPKEKKATAPKSTEKKVKDKAEKVEKEETPEEQTSHPDGFIKISFGMDMPTYLL